MRRAVVAGSACASFTCEAFGTARLEEVKREEVDARIQTLTALVATA
jgi:hypothetical protein